ncbi:histidine kinase [Putridiphycobacter roseus]|uniref:Histidine kinase n=1 Tax=Putridiphycobacter roseus TaxID=2219161 RepID=A0A2W1NKH1_9FLAO|nr:histidine kinase [Putridiphycobacter roseus]PZE16162.1 histidine kinase [Putridiphycobacter roseus]
MRIQKLKTNNLLLEILFQLALAIIVFIFYAFERKHGQRSFNLEPAKIACFINYLVAAYFINYYLLPKFLYRKKYLLFSLLVLFVITCVIFIEEGIIERIYFPETKGSHFPGIFIGLTDALPTITIIAGFKFAWDALRKQKELEQLKLAVNESELQFLKSQINPHFLFNNLNNLYAYALEKSSKTPDIILELSAVLRYMLYECQAAYVSLEKEMIHLENFVNLSKLQFEERGTVHFTKPSNSTHYNIAPLILSVFVENAFKHSAASQTDNINIATSIELSDSGELLFTCENNFSVQSNTNSLPQGIGLENVKKRLTLIYPNAHALTINTENNIYKVTLTLNLKN